MEALEAATGVSMGSADQMEEDDEDEIDDEIDPDDEDEDLAMQQPPVHDVHVSSEAVPAAGTSGRDRVPDPSRLGSTRSQTMAEQLYTPDWQHLLEVLLVTCRHPGKTAILVWNSNCRLLWVLSVHEVLSLAVSHFWHS